MNPWANDEPVPHQEVPSQEEKSADESNFPPWKIIKKKNGKVTTIWDSVKSPSEAAEDISYVKKRKEESEDEIDWEYRKNKTKVNEEWEK